MQRSLSHLAGDLPTDGVKVAPAVSDSVVIVLNGAGITLKSFTS